MANFTERLRQLRDESGKTQSQIAKELGLTPQAFSYFVNGREPNYETLGKIADYFQVSVDYLIGKTEIRTTNLTKKAICEATALSEASIDRLHSIVDVVATAGGSFGKFYVGEFIEDLLSYDDVFSLIGNYGMYKRAKKRVDIYGEHATWCLDDLDSSIVNNAAKALESFYNEMDDNFFGAYQIVVGSDYLEYYKQQVIGILTTMLPKMAGVKENDESFKKDVESISALWNEIHEIIKNKNEKVKEEALEMKPEAPNDETHEHR